MAKTKAQAREAAAWWMKPTTSKTRVDPNRFVFDGKDDDDPPSDEHKPKTGRLSKEFVRILRTAFQVKEDSSHEVFQALQSEGIYTWPLFIMIDMELVRNLTKPTKKNPVPVLYQTKATLKSLLMLYLRASMHYPDAESPSTYTDEIILDYLKENMKDGVPGTKLASTYAPKAAIDAAERCRCKIEAEAEEIKQRHAEDHKSETIHRNAEEAERRA